MSNFQFFVRMTLAIVICTSGTSYSAPADNANFFAAFNESMGSDVEKEQKDLSASDAALDEAFGPISDPMEM